MSSVKRWLVGLLLSAALAAAALVWLLQAWATQPLTFRASDASAVFVIAPGASGKSVANLAAKTFESAWPQAVHSGLWWLHLRLTGRAGRLQAGEYAVSDGDTPAKLIDKWVKGEQLYRKFTIVEGWTFRQVLQALQKEERLIKQIPGQSGEINPKMLLQALGKTGMPLEGLFFPDTYRFATGQSDLDILKAASAAMDERLSAAWAQRPKDSVLESPQQALILASIVEKETGTPQDRGRISGVFHNRLRIGMRLQTDPTVIYGLGERFDGNLRRVDLQTDTPFNTYTRAGLPPTPIAMPGKAALQAAINPEPTDAMYFVARGDGTSQFSSSLAEHNRAVDKYIRNR